jgi:predicted acyltransferase
MNSNPKRLYSLDVLRGFDMFWIMGAEDVIHQLSETNPSPITSGMASVFTHSAWHGFTPYDLIFPLFLFIAGVAAPFSIGRDLQHGVNRRTLALRALKRGGILVFLGIIYNLHGFQIVPFAEIRFASVLGHIGIAWALATIIFIYVNRWQQIIYIIIAILLAYWALLFFGHAPNFPAGNLTKEGNIVSYFDRLYLPGKLHNAIHDPEGLLSKIPAVATALLGIGTGLLLKTEVLTPIQKIKRMLIIGFGLLALGMIWNFVLPINKNLWTSSFFCITGGLSSILMATFYYIVDLRQMNGILAFFFSVIGVNSILIYLSDRFINWEFSSKAVFGWLNSLVSEHYGSLIIVIGILVLKWLFLWFLNKKKIYLRV